MHRLLIFVVTTVLTCSMGLSAAFIVVDSPVNPKHGLLMYYGAYVWNSNYGVFGNNAANIAVGANPKFRSMYQWNYGMDRRYSRLIEVSKKNIDNVIQINKNDNGGKVINNPLIHYWVVKNEMNTIGSFNSNMKKQFYYHWVYAWKRAGTGCLIVKHGNNHETVIETHHVPESSMMVFLGLGLAGLPFLRRKKAYSWQDATRRILKCK